MYCGIEASGKASPTKDKYRSRLRQPTPTSDEGGLVSNIVFSGSQEPKKWVHSSSAANRQCGKQGVGGPMVGRASSEAHRSLFEEILGKCASNNDA